ncbi:MAG: VWA domain-containing protein [Terracidiphilus sp.]
MAPGLRRMCCRMLLALASPVLAAQPTALRMDVKLVNVFVSVTGRNGDAVGGLTGKDFTLSEDGRPQRIAVFEREPETPLRLTLAIDTSGSVRKDMAAEARAAREFARILLREQDQMSVLEFAGQVRELTPFTRRVRQIDHGLSRLRGGSATALYDAICAASKQLGGRAGRRVLVLISDGDDTAGGATYAEALEQALLNGVTIDSIIDVPILASAGRDLGGEHALISLAEQTGGESFYFAAGAARRAAPDQPDPLERAFRQMAASLRSEYLLGYYPHFEKPGTAFHRIEVTLPAAGFEGVRLHYRSGYYAGSPGGDE